PEDPSIPPLRFTQNDAEGLKQVLEDPETCGFETRLYLNEISQKVLADLEQISEELEADDTLLFYYAGHGKLRRDGQLCLASSDTTMAHLGARSIRAREVLTYLQESHARRRLLILDCCQSGAIGREFRGNDLQSSLRGLADSFGSYILTASTAIQLAEEREKDGHGVFTKALIDCLREGSKESITVNDWYEYACSCLKGIANQTPLKWGLQEQGRSFEIGNFRAKHERERQRKHEQLERERQRERERLERERQLEQERLEQERRLERERLISTARVRLGAYVALGELTEEQVEEAIALLKRDDARLFPRDRRYRNDLIRFSKGEASFLEVFGVGQMLRPEPSPKPAEDEVGPPNTPTEAPV
ncbi:MAG: caspase family protein, partial [Terriglobia bacterium]